MTAVVLAAGLYFPVRRILNSTFGAIRDLTEVTGQIGPYSLGGSIPMNGVPSTMKPLVENFNQMIGKLDVAFKHEQQLALKLAHELRTPVSEMRMLMEVAAFTANSDSKSEEEAGRTYRCGARISQRMSKLIETLTAIHHGEAGNIDIVSEPIDMERLVAEAVANLTSAEQARCRIVLQRIETATVETDATILRAIIDNLLGNALDHSPPGTEVTVRHTPEKLLIINEAPSLSEADIARMEDMFWQKMESIDSDQHLGLGLNLVSAYVRLLDAGVERTILDGRLTTALVLPFSKK